MNSVKKTVPMFVGILILASYSSIQFAPSVIDTAHAEPSKRIVGYFPYWESGDVDSIDYSKLTDIIYFHIWPNPDGSIDTNAINQNDLNTITSRAHSEGVNVLIAVGGWGVSDGFPSMAQDDAARAYFVSNVRDFILENNLDGVDIDWETPIDADKIDNQDILLADLANTIRPLGKMVTVAANGDVVELKPNAVNSVDWVNVMAYDMNWNNAEHSTFDDAVAALQRYEDAGIPKEKLDLGIPFYGRTDGWTSEIKYEDIVSTCTPAPQDNYCENYFFNGIDLVQDKADYVLNNGYDGIMVWNLGQDTYDQTSLLNAINEILSGDPLPNTNVHLEDLEISKSGNKRWSATVTITVFDQSNNGVSGATVSGTWSGGSTDTSSCITSPAGKCNVSQSTRGENLTFTVNDISGYRLTYDETANIVSETISINKDGTIPGQNLPPVANSGGPYTSTPNTTIVFDGSGSSDPEGDQLTFLWQFGDGSTSTQVNPSHSYSADGVYQINLQVTDSKGQTSTDSTTATISTQSNSIAIYSISPNLLIKGQTITAVINGGGFDQNASVKFQGDKFLPSVISQTILDDQNIKIEVTRSTAGPKQDYVYDLTVTNPNGDSFTLPQSFTVID